MTDGNPVEVVPVEEALEPQSSQPSTSSPARRGVKRTAKQNIIHTKNHKKIQEALKLIAKSDGQETVGLDDSPDVWDNKLDAAYGMKRQFVREHIPCAKKMAAGGVAPYTDVDWSDADSYRNRGVKIKLSGALGNVDGLEERLHKFINRRSHVGGYFEEIHWPSADECTTLIGEHGDRDELSRQLQLIVHAKLKKRADLSRGEALGSIGANAQYLHDKFELGKTMVDDEPQSSTVNGVDDVDPIAAALADPDPTLDSTALSSLEANKARHDEAVIAMQKHLLEDDANDETKYKSDSEDASEEVEESESGQDDLDALSGDDVEERDGVEDEDNGVEDEVGDNDGHEGDGDANQMEETIKEDKTITLE